MNQLQKLISSDHNCTSLFVIRYFGFFKVMLYEVLEYLAIGAVITSVKSADTDQLEIRCKLLSNKSNSYHASHGDG